MSSQTCHLQSSPSKTLVRLFSRIVLENQACLLLERDTLIRSSSLCSFVNVHKLKHEFMSTSMAVYMFTMNISKA